MMSVIHKTYSRLKRQKVKKRSRFNGVPEEEILGKTLPDLLIPNLDIVIIGINPGLSSAFKGHHYAGPSNHFWKCLNLAGFTPTQMFAMDDFKLLNFGIGFTNVVERTSKSSIDLNKQEIVEGCKLLLKKLQTFRPKIAVFNGKLIYEIFSCKKYFNYGVQLECVEGTNTYIWVMPSSSGRIACYPSPSDKLPFYIGLKKFRDYINGTVTKLDKEDFIFPSKSNKCSLTLVKKEVKSEYFQESTCNYSKLCVINDVNPIRQKNTSENSVQGDMETNLKLLRMICQRNI